MKFKKSLLANVLRFAHNLKNIDTDQYTKLIFTYKVKILGEIKDIKATIKLIESPNFYSLHSLTVSNNDEPSFFVRMMLEKQIVELIRESMSDNYQRLI